MFSDVTTNWRCEMTARMAELLVVAELGIVTLVLFTPRHRIDRLGLAQIRCLSVLYFTWNIRNHVIHYDDVLTCNQSRQDFLQ